MLTSKENADTTIDLAGGPALEAIRARIADAATQAQRPAAAISLLAVSKGQSIEAIRRLAAQGLNAFGENYVQEALPKMTALATLNLSWHFIGRLQANKTREVATHFAWVHSVDRIKVAERLSAQRPAHLLPLECCIEVNLNGETTKAGVDPGALAEIIAALKSLPRLRLRGLMALPAPALDPIAQRAGFRRLRELAAAYAAELDTLSMGTSEDFTAAIMEGATIVRIGTALFGPRPRA